MFSFAGTLCQELLLTQSKDSPTLPLFQRQPHPKTNQDHLDELKESC